MKKELFFTFVALGVALTTDAQKPFKEIGKDNEVELLTLSNGRYVEHFSNDTLRRIGSVMFNTINNKIEYFIPQDDVIWRTELDRAKEASRFMSTDPLAGNYPFFSPYQFAGNTPIMAIDQDGKNVYFVNLETGQVYDVAIVLKTAQDIGNESFIAGAKAALLTSTGKEGFGSFLNDPNNDVYVAITNVKENGETIKDQYSNSGTPVTSSTTVGNLNGNFEAFNGLDISQSEGRNVSFVSLNSALYSGNASGDEGTIKQQAETIGHEFFVHAKKGIEHLDFGAFESVLGSATANGKYPTTLMDNIRKSTGQASMAETFMNELNGLNNDPAFKKIVNEIKKMKPAGNGDSPPVKK